MKKLLFVLTIVLLLAAGCSSSKKTTDQNPLPAPVVQNESPTTTQVSAQVPADWKTYSNTQFGISFKYPPAWQEGAKLQAPPTNPTFGVNDGNMTDQGNGFQIMANSSPYQSLDEYIAAKQGELNKDPNTSSWLVKKFTLLNVGMVAGTFYTKNTNGDNTDIAQPESVIFIKNNIMYIFNDYRSWQQSNPIGYQIASSIQFFTPALACAQDAKVCPDGSFVTRSGPDCYFESCNDGIRLPTNYTLNSFTVEKVLDTACVTNSDCKTPAEYQAMSRCPFTALCLANKCSVVCPDHFGSQK